MGALNPVQCPLILGGVTCFDVMLTKELGLGAGGRTMGKSPWFVGCMCRETAAPGAGLSSGWGSPAFAHSTGQTEPSGLVCSWVEEASLRARSQHLPPFSQQHTGIVPRAVGTIT